MIKILLDSASDCRQDKERYAAIVPMTVTIDGTEYEDGVTLESEEFYRLLTQSKEFPKTAQPSPEQFLRIFEEAKEKGDEVIYFAVSSALSGTFQSATIAKNMVDYDKIHIIDSLTITHGIRMLGEHALKLAEEGKSAAEIVSICQELKHRVKIFAGLDTLEFLQKGGRLSKASAVVGELAKIKPVVSVSPEGTVAVVSKTMGKVRAIQQIVKQLTLLPPDESFPIWSLYTTGQENTALLEKNLSDYAISQRLQVGPTIGAHVGPGVYGVVYITK